MNTINEKKIKQAVEASQKYPNPTIEYNFKEEVDLKLFDGVNAVENKNMEMNSAKVVYKFQ